jgi:hypothetical protein
MRPLPFFFVLALCLIGNGRAGTAAPSDRLSPGPHDARVGDVTLHYVVAGRGSPVLIPSPSWGPGSLYL